ncbi:3-oxoadipate enol-lactonase [Pararobbsia silviterrae]|uniref:3-oxoadipate enol-lactonase n=1 Tax=Pararobbsia silviterrae TaxID=1792498 RepID=A0A494XWE9_9BURK|nr:3-oxoadipate enol-lactonase [Pararobbsia silviterrae]RKP51923.1 3-oxoadipate enol-lactonase [Pararobbsia silviterrae]
MPYASIKGVEIHYRIDGAANTDAPWIVFSNSLGADVSMWTPQLAAFASRYRVLRYDTRGHGHSDAPKGSYTIEQLTGDVLGLFDTLSISRAHFCGISMGGLTGVALAARYPDRIDRVVLANTAAKIGSDEVWGPRADKARQGGMASLADAVLPRWFTPAFVEREPLMYAHIRDVFVHTDNEGYASNCDALRIADLRGETHNIRARALVIAGTHDVAATPAQGQELAASIAGARYVEFDASHISNIELPDAFNATVLDFLAEA